MSRLDRLVRRLRHPRTRTLAVISLITLAMVGLFLARNASRRDGLRPNVAVQGHPQLVARPAEMPADAWERGQGRDWLAERGLPPEPPPGSDIGAIPPGVAPEMGWGGEKRKGQGDAPRRRLRASRLKEE